MAKSKKFCARCLVAQKHLVELLKLTTVVKSDPRPITVPQFSEAALYPLFWKDRARTILAILSDLASALEIDFDHPGETQTVSDQRTSLLKLRDGLAEAENAARHLDHDVMRIEKAQDFAEQVEYAREQIEMAYQVRSIATPESRLVRIARAMGIDEQSGRMDPRWKREESRKKEKLRKRGSKKRVK